MLRPYELGMRAGKGNHAEGNHAGLPLRLIAAIYDRYSLNPLILFWRKGYFLGDL